MEAGAQQHSILLVEDDAFLIDMYVLKFKEKGFEVHTAVDGDSALQQLRGGLKPDVVLLDLVMPGIDGFEILETIKEEKLARGAALIVLSNQSQDSDRAHAEELGVQEYIVKANTVPSEVLSRVVAVIERKISKKSK